MRTDEYRAWLERGNLAASSIDTLVSDARRVERHYGDLDQVYAVDRLEGVLGHSRVSMTLRYAHLGDREVEAAAERVGQYIGSKLGL